MSETVPGKYVGRGKVLCSCLSLGFDLPPLPPHLASTIIPDNRTWWLRMPLIVYARPDVSNRDWRLSSSDFRLPRSSACNNNECLLSGGTPTDDSNSVSQSVFSADRSRGIALYDMLRSSIVNI